MWKKNEERVLPSDIKKMDEILQVQKGKIRDTTNRTKWATLCFVHGQSTEWLSWLKTDNRILEEARIFCVVVS